jgi:hypothetical protein
VFCRAKVLVYDFLQQNKQRNAEAITRGLIEGKLSDLLASLNDLGVKTNINYEQALARAVPSVLRFQTLLVYLFQHYERFDDLLKAKNEYLRGTQLQHAMATIKKGQIYWDIIDYPELIIYLFKKENITDFKAKIALILTFWHNYVRRQPREERIEGSG